VIAFPVAEPRAKQAAAGYLGKGASFGAVLSGCAGERATFSIMASVE